MSVFTADEELLVHICNCLHHLSAEVLHVDSFVLVLVDLQLVTLLRKQVDDFLVVEFEHGDLHQKLSARGALIRWTIPLMALMICSKVLGIIPLWSSSYFSPSIV